MLITKEDMEIIDHYLDLLEINDFDFYEDVEDRIYDTHLEKEIMISSGETKVCLIFRNLPYVLKWNNPERSSEEEATAEVKIYNAAVEAGVQDFFPETCAYKNTCFVIQEKVDSSYAELSRQTSEDYKNRYRLTENEYDKTVRHLEQSGTDDILSSINQDWCKFAISCYGDEAFNNFASFVMEYEINDLHGGNIGFLHDKPVLLDFCGYHSSYCDSDSDSEFSSYDSESSWRLTLNEARIDSF